MADRNLMRTGLLAILVAALGAFNWNLAGTEVDISPLGRDAAAVEPAANSESAIPSFRPHRSLSEFSETVSRPLFHPTRRPVVVAAASQTDSEIKPAQPAEPADVPTSRFSLVGVMINGGNARALIRAEGQTYGTWVDAGGVLDGWRLSAIKSDRVSIEKDGGQEELLLHATPKN